MSLYDCIEKINVEKAVEYVSKLQQEDGSFVGDKWGMLIMSPWFFHELLVSGYISEND